MLNKIITWSLEHRFLVLLFSLILIATGTQALFKLPIDAFPDTTPTQVQINTTATSLSPLEVEQQITFPIEQTISGIPKLANVRSISKFGLSQVTAIFEDGTDILLARQLISERIQTVELPNDIEQPKMGPMTTGLGEVYHYIVSGDGQSLQELTTLHNWVIKPRLSSIPGVAEINTWGGEQKQYHILIDIASLVQYDLVLEDIFKALKNSNINVGAGQISQSGEMHLIQGIGLTENVQDIAKIVIKSFNGMPILISDIADVEISHQIRRGASTANGKGEIVLGLGFILMGENTHQVTSKLKEKMREIQDSLPKGVTIKPVYERTDLVDQVISTVRKNLLEGALLVIAVLFIFLGNLRAGLIVAAAIPLSMLFAFNQMLQFGIAGSLMSLGAIDFGLIVDSSVIMIENSVRHLSENKSKRSVINVVKDASIEVRKPTMFGELIIMIVFLPILTLEGVEGKLFRPMALTVIFALVGSLIMSLTLMPVLASLFLSKNTKEHENIIVRFTKNCYRPIVHIAIRFRILFVSSAIALLIWSTWLSTKIGSEFIPRLSEMGIVINTVRLAGVSLDESVRYGTQIEKVILSKFPDEVKDVWTRTGTAEVATDPMGIELSDVFISLKPRNEWTKAKGQDELTSIMRKELSDLPGMRMIFTQPIEMRVNEMIAGIRSDLGIKIFGDDLSTLKEKASEVEAIVKSIKGSADVYSEQITGQPILEIKIDQDAIARHGIQARRVLEIIETIGTKKIGEIRKDQRRFDLVVRLKEKHRKSPQEIGNILVHTPSGQRLPLSQLTTINQIEGPSTITREWQKRRIVVQCNISERDIKSFVKEVQHKLNEQVALPTGYHISYGGQFEHLERAQTRLMIVVPLALFMILMLLYTSTNSIKDTLIIFTGAPFAALGGIIMLWIRDMPFTISAGVGFVAVSGVSMLNGLVMVSTIKQFLSKGDGLEQAVEKSALLRLRPVLITALVAGLGFVPMAFNTGVGAEVQRPLATVVIGGVISDNILTLLILPALYVLIFKSKSATPVANQEE